MSFVERNSCLCHLNCTEYFSQFVNKEKVKSLLQTVVRILLGYS